MRGFIVLGAAVAALAGTAAGRVAGKTPTARCGAESRVVAQAKCAPRFVENAGQWGGDVAFVAVGKDRTLVFGSQSMTLAQTGASVEYAFDGARDVRPRGGTQARATYHYFRGGATARHARTFSSVLYDGVWPGIGVRFDARPAAVEYSLVVAPGADAGAARIRVHGATRVERTATGALAVTSVAGTVTHSRPVAWQESGAARTPVAVAFDVAPRDDDGSWTYGFALGVHDPSRAVVVDPTLDIEAVQAGLDDNDHIAAVAADAQGNAYAVGESGWDGSVPVASAAYDGTLSGVRDAWIAKFDRQGDLEWATFLGGELSQATGGDQDRAEDVAVTSAGEIVVCGYKNTSDFPQVAGPALGVSPYSAWLARLGNDGATLQHCGAIGGHNPHVAVATDGAAYVAWQDSSGVISSHATATLGPQNGGTFIGVGKFSSAGAIEWLADLRQSNVNYYNEVRQIALDAQGRVYLSGRAESNTALPPAAVTNAYGGGGDGFVIELDPETMTLPYALYLGGNSSEDAIGLAVDSKGAAWVSGYTSSSLNTFPRIVGTATGATADREGRVFFARIPPAGLGAPTVWAADSWYTSASTTQEFGVAVDALDRVYAAGYSRAVRFENDGATVTDCARSRGRPAIVSPREYWYADYITLQHVVDMSASVPDHLAAVPLSPRSIRVSWVPTGDDEIGFRVERAEGDGPFDVIATLDDGGATFLIDEGLQPDRVYRYRVTALTAITQSVPAKAVETRTPATVRVRVRRANVVERSGPGRDTVVVRGSVRPLGKLSTWTFDPAADDIRVIVGEAFDLRVPDGSSGWTPRGGGWQWVSPIGDTGMAVLRIDLLRRRFALRVTGIDLTTVPRGGDEVTLRFGRDAGSQTLTWDNANRSVARAR